MGGYLNTVSYIRKSLVGSPSTNPVLQDQSTSYSTDAFGHVILETTNSDAANFSWDENGNLRSVTPPGAPQHDQSHSLLDQLLTYAPPALPPTTPVTPVNTSYTYTADR